MTSTLTPGRQRGTLAVAYLPTALLMLDTAAVNNAVAEIA
jgi:hypothetical protein